jgi:hypothetical protein
MGYLHSSRLTQKTVRILRDRRPGCTTYQQEQGTPGSGQAERPLPVMPRQASLRDTVLVRQNQFADTRRLRAAIAASVDVVAMLVLTTNEETATHAFCNCLRHCCCQGAV